MNREQKIQFIRGYHQRLYERLKENVPAILEDDWLPAEEDIKLYNSILKDYCKDYNGSLIRILSM